MYIIIAYRWGNYDGHSYPIGVFEEKDKATSAAESHCKYRGGKYACVVFEAETNHFNNEDDTHAVEIYRAKSLKG